MATSNIRVLALDLDGTLTNDQKEITPRTRAENIFVMDEAGPAGPAHRRGAPGGSGAGAGPAGRLYPIL